MSLTIGVPLERFPGERRVAASPEVIEKLINLGFPVIVESNAGNAADMPDDVFRNAGAKVVETTEMLWDSASLIFKVRPPTQHELSLMREGTTLIGFIWPSQNSSLLDGLAKKNITTIAMDCIPRISRAQKCDALSSMANIAGYRAVVEAAHHFGRFFTGQITAAGKVPPAKVFVIGAGVAGLAALGTAVSLGAIVRANDTRSEVRDQIRSMGAEFVSVEYQEEGAGSGGYAKVMSEEFQLAQRKVFAAETRDADIIITTALIPGKPAPLLITAEMVQSMRPGSVIVDLAAEQGGNCELTFPGEAVTVHGVTIIGYTDLPSRMARQSSTLYATNLLHLIEELCKGKDGIVNIDMNDEMVRGATVVKEGKITWPPPAVKMLPAASPTAPPPPPSVSHSAPIAEQQHQAHQGVSARTLTTIFVLGALLFWALGTFAPAAFLGHLTVFVLACFVGYMVVWNVTAALHTPLMSVTNAISSIIIIGALFQISPPRAEQSFQDNLIFWFSLASIVLTSINMFGGFAVTRRMIAMFQK